MQPELQFPSSSPINTISLTGQNKLLYDYLLNGNIDMFIAREIGIGFLNSRVSDLKKHKIEIYSKYIKKNNSTVKLYSLTEFKK